VADIYLTNTLTGEKEKFEPIAPPDVGIYACGPTVYDYAHIGHMRRYVGDDILRNVMELNGYHVKYVMNITDVGHLTSDADTGEDKIERAAAKSGKSAWDIAKFFENQFFTSTEALGIRPPDITCKATDHIKEQIELINKLEKNGFTYKTEDGIYFDTSRLPNYGVLGGGKEGIKAGARVDAAGKKNPTDFALWKFSPSTGSGLPRRQMEWESPWGVGFPGWHIECSAMSMKYLGEAFDPFGKLKVNGEQCRTIDIHTGGVDHVQIHHNNEIAQSRGATGKDPVRFWLHHEFLQIDGQKMAKSLGNTYTVDDVVKKGFNPMALRYLFLTANYRDPLNFTWESLGGAQTSLEKLCSQISAAREQTQRSVLSMEKNAKIEKFRGDFVSAVNDDMNTSKALATFWEMLKSNIPSPDKYDLALSFDEVLGLGLREVSSSKYQASDNIQKLVDEREKLRTEGKFEGADKIRRDLEAKGFIVEDTSKGPKIKPK